MTFKQYIIIAVAGGFALGFAFGFAKLLAELLLTFCGASVK